MIKIPKPNRYPDFSQLREPFHAIISVDDWAKLSRGADLSPYRPVTHQQLFRVERPLGTWSGERDDSFFLDSCPEASPVF